MRVKGADKGMRQTKVVERAYLREKKRQRARVTFAELMDRCGPLPSSWMAFGHDPKAKP